MNIDVSFSREMTEFRDKVVIVTGAASGMGAATALALAKEGVLLTIVDIKAEKLRKVSDKCQKFEGCQVLEIVCDLAKYENLKPIVEKTVEKYDRIDVLINVAGFGEFCPVEDYGFENYQLLFDVNLRAPFFLTKFCLPHLKKTKGCVVNVSSRLSTATVPTAVPYGMTKAALDYFTRGLAAESAISGVRVNNINPGITATDFFSRTGRSAEQLAADQPLGIIEPETIAETIMFIVRSSHMTGSCVVLDAGSRPERH